MAGHPVEREAWGENALVLNEVYAQLSDGCDHSRIERRFLALIEAHSFQLLRYALVVLFVWFGLLTVTGVSETAGPVSYLFWFVSRGFSYTAGWSGDRGRSSSVVSADTLLAGVLLPVHARVVMLPLVLYPCETLSYFLSRPSFEEVYLIKDVGWDADC